MLYAGWAVANMDARSGWLKRVDLTPAVVEDILTNLAARRDGVALRDLLLAVPGQPEAEKTLAAWLMDRPNVLIERWCAPAVATALTQELAGEAAARRWHLLVFLIRESIRERRVSQAQEAMFRVMARLCALPSNAPWTEAHWHLLLYTGKAVWFETEEGDLWSTVPGLDELQHLYGMRLRSLGQDVVERSPHDIEQYATALDYLFQDVPDPWLINCVDAFVEWPALREKWTLDLGTSLLNGLSQSVRLIGPHREQMACSIPELEEQHRQFVQRLSLDVLRSLRDLPMDDRFRSYLVERSRVYPRALAYAALGMPDPERRSEQMPSKLLLNVITLLRTGRQRKKNLNA